jgi:hypothetical protein
VIIKAGTNPTLDVPRVRTPREILIYLLERENASWWTSAIELEHHVHGEELRCEALESIRRSA